MRKKRKEEKQNLEELSSARRRSQAKCQLVQTSYIKRIELFLFLPYNRHFINRADLGRVYSAFGLYLRPRSRFSHTNILLG